MENPLVGIRPKVFLFQIKRFFKNKNLFYLKVQNKIKVAYQPVGMFAEVFTYYYVAEKITRIRE
jgi:hypothetical protein